MFRDDRLIETTTSAWQAFQSEMPVAAARTSVVENATAPDEVGAVWHVYQEIAQRIPRKAYTRHASALGGTSG
ncbi:MAG: hypothetical protein ACREPX_12995 [Rhodanobacteraceae bacterium]